jgi:eukaryotic-like serine/threonine-protein kinase
MNIDLIWLQQRFPDITGFTLLGRGGQKLVFSGHHASEGSIVLKLCHLGGDSAERLPREIEAMQRLPFVRIPRILDAGTTPSPLGEVLWVREELIAGNNLRLLLQRGPLAPPAVLRVGLHLVETLAAAEQVRIVHRDVKPENIMVGHDGSGWLLDFGLARHLDQTSLTATAAPFGVGTPGYCPPEQFQNRKSEIDARADLFALGVTLYECVEGVNPLLNNARDVGEILRRTESQPLPPLSRPVDSVGELSDLVVTMTRIRYTQRPRTAAEALAWIREICAREGIA